jgi:hypothetical protein
VQVGRAETFGVEGARKVGKGRHRRMKPCGSVASSSAVRRGLPGTNRRAERRAETTGAHKARELVKACTGRAASGTGAEAAPARQKQGAQKRT